MYIENTIPFESRQTSQSPGAAAIDRRRQPVPVYPFERTDSRSLSHREYGRTTASGSQCDGLASWRSR